MPEKEPKINKKRIFCVITQGEFGGAQQFLIQLANHLDPEQFDLHIVWGNGPSVLGRQIPSHITTASAQHLMREISPWHDLKAVDELREMMRHYRPDTVLCLSSKAGFIGARAAHGLRGRLPHMRVIYRIGGWTFNDPWPQWKKRLYRWLEKFSARWKDVIVVNNLHDLEQARALGIRPRHELLCIPNGIDPYLDILPQDQARTAIKAHISERYRDLPTEHLVGTIANFYPAKDLDTLIRAAARVSSNVRFAIIGEGQLRPHLEQLIAEHNLQSRFFLLGSMPHAYRYLSAFDVFVLPSAKEGFPWAILEAMAAKIPVIATRVGAIPEILEDHRSGIIVPPGSPEHIAKAVVELLGNDRLRQDLAIQAHQQLITKFSLRSMIDQYEKLFA
jgi:glycosyltransferase involved in cell wall biosynthesis